jgi:hypothetical protein
MSAESEGSPSVHAWSPSDGSHIADDCNVLRKALADDVRTEPFPYLVIEDCLPPDLYDALARAYPSDDQILTLNAARRGGRIRQNQRNNVSAHQILGKHALDRIWEQFVRFHTSASFYAEVLRVFGSALLRVYPDLEQRLGGRLQDLQTGVRFDPSSDLGSISLDCQIAINTSVARVSSVRGVHADAPEELFAMLLYCRRPEDDSSGGDLEIWRWKDGRRPAFIGAEAYEPDSELVATIPYRANTLVAFINSDAALHAISDRSVTRHSRRLVNIIGEVYRPLPGGLFVKPQRPFANLIRLRRAMTRQLGVTANLGSHRK